MAKLSSHNVSMAVTAPGSIQQYGASRAEHHYDVEISGFCRRAYGLRAMRMGAEYPPLLIEADLVEDISLREALSLLAGAPLPDLTEEFYPQAVTGTLVSKPVEGLAEGDRRLPLEVLLTISLHRGVAYLYEGGIALIQEKGEKPFVTRFEREQLRKYHA